MGVLDTLSAFNERVARGTSKTLDNERFSVQDNVRAAHMRALGHDDEQEYARAVSQDYQAASDGVADRAGRVADRAGVDDDSRARGAGRGVQSAVDLFVGHPVKTVYGGATGANAHARSESEVGTDYSPDAIDTAELGLIAGGPVGRGAGAAARGGARKASSAAKNASNSEIMAIGALGRIAQRARSTVGRNTPRTTKNPGTRTRSGTNTRKPDTSQTENLRIPQHLLPNAARTSASSAGSASSKGFVRRHPFISTVIGTSAGLGAMGVIGGPGGQDIERADGYSVDRNYQKPPASRIKVTDEDGNVLGYYVLIDESGGTFTAITGQASTFSVEFPTTREPTFDSPEQADQAYDKWAREIKNQGQNPGWYAGSDEEDDYAWGDGAVVQTLEHGWHLIEQEHNTKDEVRYFVAGRDSSGRLIYIGQGGRVATDAPPFPTGERAGKAYQKWESRNANGNARAPDPGADRPSPAEVVQHARQAGRDGSSGLGTIGLAALGVGGALIAALIVGVLL